MLSVLWAAVVLFASKVCDGHEILKGNRGRQHVADSGLIVDSSGQHFFF